VDVWDGFSFPTGLAADASGGLYVTESGLPFGGAPPDGRVWVRTAAGTSWSMAWRRR